MNELGAGGNVYSVGKMDDEYQYNMGAMTYQQSDSSTLNAKNTQRSTIWSKISWNKNSNKKKYIKQSSNSSMNRDLYQPLTHQGQWEV